MPIRNPASCGAGEVLTPSNEALRVAPDALSLKEETAVMFPSPEVPPPDELHSYVTEIVLIFSVPVAVNVTLLAEPVHVPAEKVAGSALKPPTVAPVRTIDFILPVEVVNVKAPFL